MIVPAPRPLTEADPLSAPAVEVVVHAVRRALASEVGDPLDHVRPVPWDAADPSDVHRAASVHRVVPLLVEQAAAVDAPDVLRSAWRSSVMADAVRSLEMAGETRRAAEALARAGIPAVVLKGAALSLQTTGRLGARGAGADIDLLVRPHDLHAAHAVLEAAGWAGDDLREPGRWWSWYLRVRRERSYVSPTSTIDLHWRVGWHDRPLPGVDDLLARREFVSIGGTAVPTLSPSDAMAASCYHAELDRYARLRGLVDVVRLARREDTRVPAGSSWQLRRLIGEAVAFCADLLGSVAPARRSVFVPALGVEVARVATIWAHSSTRPIWSGSDIPLAELLAVYRDSARFAGPVAALEMAMTDALVPPERITPDTGPGQLAGAVAAEVADLVRRRVRLRT